MNTFDQIIGYENIKSELMQVCDIVHNREVYKKLGAKLPRGVILYGEPGLGKSLMAKCFIKERGLTSYTIRKNKGNDFLAYIEERHLEKPLWEKIVLGISISYIITIIFTGFNLF